MRILILQNIISNFSDKKKGHVVRYAEKDELLNAIERPDKESILVDGKKEKFILFKSDLNKTYKTI